MSGAWPLHEYKEAREAAGVKPDSWVLVKDVVTPGSSARGNAEIDGTTLQNNRLSVAVGTARGM